MRCTPLIPYTYATTTIKSSAVVSHSIYIQNNIVSIQRNYLESLSAKEAVRWWLRTHGGHPRSEAADASRVISVLASTFRRFYRLEEIEKVLVGRLSVLKPNSFSDMDFEHSNQLSKCLQHKIVLL